MHRGTSVLFLLTMTALLFWIMPGLIHEQTDQPAETASAPLTQSVMMELVGTLPEETTAATVCRRTVDFQQRAFTAVQPQQPAVRVTCDGNGSPLGSEAWFHAVYQACPPEA